MCRQHGSQYAKIPWDRLVVSSADAQKAIARLQLQSTRWTRGERWGFAGPDAVRQALSYSGMPQGVDPDLEDLALQFSPGSPVFQDNYLGRLQVIGFGGAQKQDPLVPLSWVVVLSASPALVPSSSLDKLPRTSGIFLGEFQVIRGPANTVVDLRVWHNWAWDWVVHQLVAAAEADDNSSSAPRWSEFKNLGRHFALNDIDHDLVFYDLAGAVQNWKMRAIARMLDNPPPVAAHSPVATGSPASAESLGSPPSPSVQPQFVSPIGTPEDKEEDQLGQALRVSTLLQTLDDHDFPRLLSDLKDLSEGKSPAFIVPAVDNQLANLSSNLRKVHMPDLATKVQQFKEQFLSESRKEAPDYAGIYALGDVLDKEYDSELNKARIRLQSQEKAGV